MDVDTRLLRCFVAVADERSFTGAAHRLFESQPTVSRQIRRLEELLRTPLFHRGRGAARLTPAGTALLPSARRITDEWRVAVGGIRAAATDGARVLRVGYAVTDPGDLMAAAHAAFAARHPGVTVAPKRLGWGREPAALRDGTVDVAFVWLPSDTSGCHTEVVARERRVLGLPAGHPLAARPGVDPDSVPARTAGASPGGAVRWWPAGEHVLGDVADIDEVVDCVAAGVALCVVPESVPTRHARAGVVWRPLDDGEPLRIALAWRPGGGPLVPAFAAVVREIARRTDSAAGRAPVGIGRVEAGRCADRRPRVDVPPHGLQMIPDLGHRVGSQR